MFKVIVLKGNMYMKEDFIYRGRMKIFGQYVELIVALDLSFFWNEPKRNISGWIWVIKFHDRVKPTRKETWNNFELSTIVNYSRNLACSYKSNIDGKII